MEPQQIKINNAINHDFSQGITIVNPEESPLDFFWSRKPAAIVLGHNNHDISGYNETLKEAIKQANGIPLILFNPPCEEKGISQFLVQIRNNQLDKIQPKNPITALHKFFALHTELNILKEATSLEEILSEIYLLDFNIPEKNDKTPNEAIIMGILTVGCAALYFMATPLLDKLSKSKR